MQQSAAPNEEKREAKNGQPSTQADNGRTNDGSSLQYFNAARQN
jgi:hypothetical protein